MCGTYKNRWWWLGSGVAQLVKRSLPIPEDSGSNPVIGKSLHIS